MAVLQEIRLRKLEGYCEKMLGVPVYKFQGLKVIKDRPLPRPNKTGPAELFAWFFDAIENLVATQRRVVTDSEE
ncbi:MAG TPA: hypothetical protein VIH18_21645 [Candidatus Binatia bacterium]|jgi:hypothetical protein